MRSCRLHRPAKMKASAGASRQAATPFCRWLVIMVKPPLVGRAKTRLAREVGAVEAAAFYRHTSRAVIRRLASDPRWRTVLAVTPDVDVGARYWPSSIARVAQGRGGLGVRMQRPMNWLPPGPVVLIGTDIPAIRASHVAEAFRLLGDNDAVFGPAADGGFWLVGQRRTPRPIDAFGGVRWSVRETLSDTLRNHAGHRVGMAATLSDVDGAADLVSVNSWCGRVVVTGHCLARPTQDCP